MAAPTHSSAPPPAAGSRKPQADGKAYYGYLFNEDKTPTALLNALLRAIGLHIIERIGDKDDQQLDAKKLAAFYHAVGGDYDSLFVKTPEHSLSYIWRALGVQHTLQPTENPFEVPSIPALTLVGWVRWESLQILLGPEEHVPYMQYAVRNWHLKHPDTGETFPPNLPADSFPAVCDADVDKWHKECAVRLRDAAAHPAQPAQPAQPAPSGESTPKAGDSPPLRREPSNSRMRPAYSHQPRSAPMGAAPQRPGTEYGQRKRPVSYIHTTTSVPRYAESRPDPRPHQPMDPHSHHHSGGSNRNSFEDIPRRRSYQDIKPHPKEDLRSSVHLDPHAHPSHGRRHSHSHYQAPSATSISSSDSESDVPPQRGPSTRGSPPRSAPAPRLVQVAPPPAANASRSRRNTVRSEEPPPSRSFASEIKHRLVPFLHSSSDRQRSSSRDRRPVALHSSVRYARNPVSRSMSRSSYASEESEAEISPKYTPPSSRESHRVREQEKERDRQLERARERARDRERRELEEELERKSRHKEKVFIRPAVNRRTSSHADIDRRAQDVAWDPRDRRRESRDLEREVRRNLTSDEMERDRRERRRYKDEVSSPPVTGVGGRRYPRQAGS
ncbi:hypothetical protein F5Y18DRAFT_306083 [Xylariaceae sp. FL1019]|nr:hypothetical protein F5Y18DRAFT_306083 [Xylariaceae sp. FL1019]